jgi:hypothetical protein
MLRYAFMSVFLAEYCHGKRRTLIPWLWERERTVKKESMFDCFVFFCISSRSLYVAMAASISIFYPYIQGPFSLFVEGVKTSTRICNSGFNATPGLPSSFLMKHVIDSIYDNGFRLQQCSFHRPTARNHTLQTLLKYGNNS